MSSSWTAPQFDRAALLTIDVQQDTLDDQPFEIPGTSQALPEIAKLAQAFRAAGAPVFHVLRLYLPDGSNAELCRRDALRNGEQMFLAGSPGRLIAPQLLPPAAPPPDDELLLSGELQQLGPSEWYIYKPRWGAFYRTQLETRLRDLGISTVVIAGCNYPNCVRAAVYEASERDFRVVAVRDGISNFTEHGWNELRSIGINAMSVQQCVAELSQAASAPRR